MLAKKLQSAAKAVEPVYVEDVMSVFTYTGNGSTQTITNGIDLAGKGGLVWVKGRSISGFPVLQDTVQGLPLFLKTTSTDGSLNASSYLTSFGTNGFSIGSGSNVNFNGATFVSWAFRRAPKFFDVVTYTGTGSAPRALSHSLGIRPGMVVIKRTNSTGNWWVTHRSAPNQGAAYPNIGGNLYLDATDAADTGTNPALSAMDATTFTLSTNQNSVLNINGATYVAYLFAHDTASDGLIQCGSFTTDGSGNATVNLGWEPQWVLFKRTSSVGDWFTLDSMRGFLAAGGNSNGLSPNTSGAETAYGQVGPTATGFQSNAAGNFSPSATYIYIAIRRGPMKVPTDGTSVFAPIAVSPSSGQQLTTNFPVDSSIARLRTFSTDPTFWNSRLRGVALTNTTTGNQVLNTTSTAAETGGGPYSYGWDSNTSIKAGSYLAGYSSIYWNFRRAPGFFDEVCYTGNGSANLAVNHNLGVAPELIIARVRNTVEDWAVDGAYSGWAGSLKLNTTQNKQAPSAFAGAPTTTQFFVSNSGQVGINSSGAPHVAYLFATCPGVSKCFNFTGTGALQTINCGFTAGARFVLIKRTDAAGDWYIWDSSRGISSANDPYLLLNSTAAEVTTTNWVDTTSTGFQVTAASGNNVNISGASYIGLAIA